VSASDAGVPPAGPESDFSYRKMKAALIIIVAQAFATSMLPFQALTLVNVPMRGEFGWSATEFALATTALMWCGGMVNPLYGRLIDTVGVRPLVLIGTVGVALVCIALSFQTSSVWLFCFYFALLGMFGSSAIAYAKVLGSMFTQHRGKALSLIGIEGTLALAAVPPLLRWLIEDFGWRGMFLASGIIILALVPVLYWTLDEPGTIGGRRSLLNRKSPDGGAEPARPPVMPGMTVPEVLRSKTFWLIVIVTIAGMAPRNWFWPHLVPMLIEKGFTSDDAVFFMTASQLISLLGAAACGYALDKVDDARIAIPFKATLFIGILLLSMVTVSFGGFPMLMFAVAFWGFGFGTTRPMTTFMHIRFFGLKSFGFYYGFEMMLVAFAMGAGAPIVGQIADRTGSYQPAYIGLLISLFLGAFLYLFMGPYRYPRDIGVAPEAAPGEQAKDAAAPGRGARPQPA
jgi:sugar phosphate permease